MSEDMLFLTISNFSWFYSFSRIIEEPVIENDKPSLTSRFTQTEGEMPQNGCKCQTSHVRDRAGVAIYHTPIEERIFTRVVSSMRGSVDSVVP